MLISDQVILRNLNWAYLNVITLLAKTFSAYIQKMLVVIQEGQVLLF